MIARRDEEGYRPPSIQISYVPFGKPDAAA